MSEKKDIKHVSVSLATAGIFVIAIVSGMAAYYGTVNSQTKSFGDFNARVSVVETKQTTDEADIASIRNNVQFIRDLTIRFADRLQVSVPRQVPVTETIVNNINK